MNDSYGEHAPSSGFEITLSAENEEMSKSLLDGLRSVLRSDFIDIYEIVDKDRESGLFKLPKERYLAKVVFMKLALADIDSESLTESDPDFQVAVITKAHGLSVNDALERKQSDEDPSFVWPDNIQAHLLDNQLNNLASWSLSFQPGLGNEFDFTGSRRGFIRNKQSNEGIVDQAYAIDSTWDSGAGVDKNGLSPMGEFRALEMTLKRGRLDKIAAETLRVASQNSLELNWLSDNPDVVRGSVPYFNILSEAALQFTPEYRNMIAWQQYCDER